MIALILMAIQAVSPPVILAPQPATRPAIARPPMPVPLPPQDWSTLPPLRLLRRSTDIFDASAFVRAEIAAGRCTRATRTARGWALTIDLAVLAAPDGRVRRVTPRAIDCPTVEQYAAGLVLRSARDNVAVGDATTESWFRTAMTFAWTA